MYRREEIDSNYCYEYTLGCRSYPFSVMMLIQNVLVVAVKKNKYEEQYQQRR